MTIKTDEQQRAAFEAQLPPLPEHDCCGEADAYSDEAMRAYAIAAIELDRQGRESDAFERDHQKAVRAIVVTGVPEIQGLSPENAISTLSFMLDRQGRGEPVGYFRVGSAGLHEQVFKTHHNDKDVFPLFNAQQPAEPTIKESLTVAEPVKVPSDEAIGVLKLALEYWSDRQQRYRNRAPVWVTEARALLASYGKAAQPTDIVKAISHENQALEAQQDAGNNPQPAETVKAPSDDTHDYLGLALELESACKTVASQTTERAMLAAARCLRDSQDRYGQPAQSAASAEPDVVLRVVHSDHEVQDPEVVKTSRRFDNLPAGTEVKLYTAPVAAQSSVPESNLSSAPHVLNTSDKAMWVLGWNDCREAMIKGQK